MDKSSHFLWQQFSIAAFTHQEISSWQTRCAILEANCFPPSIKNNKMKQFMLCFPCLSLPARLYSFFQSVHCFILWTELLEHADSNPTSSQYFFCGYTLPSRTYTLVVKCGVFAPNKFNEFTSLLGSLQTLPVFLVNNIKRELSAECCCKLRAFKTIISSKTHWFRNKQAYFFTKKKKKKHNSRI